MSKAIALNKIDMTHLVKITIGHRYQRDPFVSHANHIRCDFVNIEVKAPNCGC